MDLLNAVNSLPDSLKGYMAGILDGEGSIGLYQVKDVRRQKVSMHWHPMVTISMVNTAIPKLLFNATGVGNLGKQKPSKEGGRQLLRWVVGNAVDIYIFLSPIKPYVIDKRRQVELMLEYCELKINRTITEDVCYRISNEISRLNKERR